VNGHLEFYDMTKILKRETIYDGVEILTFSGSIGINVSGGADSALLLYFTLLNQKEVVHVTTLGNNQRYRRNVKIASRVLEKCIQMSENSNVVHHIHNADIQTGLVLDNMIKMYYDNGTINAVTGAITANPPKEISDTFIYETTESHERCPETIREVYTRGYNNEIIGYSPFTNINKKVIAEIYKKYNLMELFELTRSCEFDPTKNNGVMVDPGMGHCGKCWWCEERKWAFGRL
jgi:7-cyano-7-deazaguanine synthase in queuosine biosynthesis